MTDLGNGLFSVSVPEKSKYYKISGLNFFCYKYDEISKWIAIEPELCCHFEILGTVTASDIDFDVHAYCENSTHNHRKYKLYPSGETNFNTISFRSLLSSKGLFFENPYGKPKYSEFCKLNRWQQAENNLVQKLIILKRL